MDSSLKAWVLAAYEAGEYLNVNGTWHNFNCPVCEDNGKRPRPTLGLNVDEGWFHCFRCGSGGKAREVIERTQLEVLYDEEKFEAVKSGMRLPHGFAPSKKGSASWEYLRSRGVPARTIQEALLGEAPDHPRYRGRVIVPWWSWDDELAGFAARTIPGEDVDVPESKYLYPKGMNRGDIYCGSELFEDTEEPIFVCEGSFDALAVWPNGVALGGSPGQQLVDEVAWRAISLGRRRFRVWILAFDRDAERKTKMFQATLARVLPEVETAPLWLPRGVNDLGELAGKPKVIRRVIEKSLGQRFRG